MAENNITEKEDEIEYSERCKICSKIPEDIRSSLTDDYQRGITYVDLCEKYNSELKSRGLEITLNPANISSHFRNHYDLEILGDSSAAESLFAEIEKSIAITDMKTSDGQYNGKVAWELTAEEEIEIKPLTKSILQVKSLRLKKLLEQLAKDESMSGGMQNLKIHREIEMIEDSMFKIGASLAKDFYLDSKGNYDKSLFIVQELARKIFITLSELQLRYNGIPEKLETITDVQGVLANLFDEYEREIDTIRPE